jgi:hypothetical protein
MKGMLHTNNTEDLAESGTLSQRQGKRPLISNQKAMEDSVKQFK